MAEKNFNAGWLYIGVFIVVALIGVGLTVWIANGSTVIGVIGGLATVVLAWLSARLVSKKV